MKADVAFDPAKDVRNRLKHGISLSEAGKLDISSALTLFDDREDYGETRYNSLAFLDPSCLYSSTPYAETSFEPLVCAKQQNGSRSSMWKVPKYGTPDAENPEWTIEDFRRAKRFNELPTELQALLNTAQKTASAQEPSEKAHLPMNLAPAIANALRATGSVWESRAEEVLRSHFVKHATAPEAQGQR